VQCLPTKLLLEPAFFLVTRPEVSTFADWIVATVHNQFNHGCHLVSRKIYKGRRSAAIAEWLALASPLGLGIAAPNKDELRLV
jgi:hypothetical protein